MTWITITTLILIAGGVVQITRSTHKIQKSVTDSRPLPWTALVEIQQRIADGDASAIQDIERLLEERGTASYGDRIADLACAGILASLAKSAQTQTATENRTETFRSNGKPTPSSEALTIPPGSRTAVAASIREA
ncbi:MAG: hypothetical protein K0U98_24845 [Deltaproteobacteria bacterium]|nr:hypothetical protein [Deltaproteobacteria bacterium]